MPPRRRRGGHVGCLHCRRCGDAARDDVHDAIGRARTGRYGVSHGGRCAIIEAAEANGLPLVSDEPLGTHAGRQLRGTANSPSTPSMPASKRSCSESAAAPAPTAVPVSCALSASGSSTMPDRRRTRRRGTAAHRHHRRHRPAPPRPEAFDGESPPTSTIRSADPRRRRRVRPAEGRDTRPGPRARSRPRASRRVLHASHAADVAALAGAGAAGGLPVVLPAMLNAQLAPGIDSVAEAMNLKALLADASLVLTGEGCLDRQTLQGKVVHGRCASHPTHLSDRRDRWCRPALCNRGPRRRHHGCLLHRPGPAQLSELVAGSIGLIEDAASNVAALFPGLGRKGAQG